MNFRSERRDYNCSYLAFLPAKSKPWPGHTIGNYLGYSQVAQELGSTNRKVGPNRGGYCAFLACGVRVPILIASEKF